MFTNLSTLVHGLLPHADTIRNKRGWLKLKEDLMQTTRKLRQQHVGQSRILGQ